MSEASKREEIAKQITELRYHYMAPTSVLNKMLDRITTELAKHEAQISAVKRNTSPPMLELKSKFETRSKAAANRGTSCLSTGSGSLPTITSPSTP